MTELVLVICSDVLCWCPIYEFYMYSILAICMGSPIQYVWLIWCYLVNMCRHLVWHSHNRFPSLPLLPWRRSSVTGCSMASWREPYQVEYTMMPFYFPLPCFLPVPGFLMPLLLLKQLFMTRIVWRRHRVKPSKRSEANGSERERET